MTDMTHDQIKKIIEKSLDKSMVKEAKTKSSSMKWDIATLATIVLAGLTFAYFLGTMGSQISNLSEKITSLEARNDKRLENIEIKIDRLIEK